MKWKNDEILPLNSLSKSHELADSNRNRIEQYRATPSGLRERDGHMHLEFADVLRVPVRTPTYEQALDQSSRSATRFLVPGSRFL